MASQSVREKDKVEKASGVATSVNKRTKNAADVGKQVAIPVDPIPLASS